MAKPKMRVIPLETKGQIKYRDILIGMFQRPLNPQGGTTVQEMRSAMPVLDLLDKAEDGDDLLLTESQWHDAKKRMESHPWAINSKEILDFCDALENAAEREVS